MHEHKDLLAEHHKCQHRTRFCGADVAGANYLTIEVATKTEGCTCGSISAWVFVSQLFVRSPNLLLTDFKALVQSRW